MSQMNSQLEHEQETHEETKTLGVKKITTSFLIVTYQMLEVSSEGLSKFKHHFLD